jgi:hypothetical protein
MRPGLVLVGTALCASAAAAPRPGKIVRVEHRSRRFSGVPRLCALSSSNLRVFCQGAKPKIDDRLAILDDHHRIGTVRVMSVDALSSCKDRDVAQWWLQTELVGDPVLPPDTQFEAVLDVPIGPQGHTVLVDNQRSERSTFGIDTDGDGRVDLEFQEFPCDEQGSPAGLAATSSCVEIWDDPDGHTLKLVRMDIIPQSCS